MPGLKARATAALPFALRQVGRTHQVAVALAGRAAALVDRPHHETLAAAAVAGGEDALTKAET